MSGEYEGEGEGGEDGRDVHFRGSWRMKRGGEEAVLVCRERELEIGGRTWS